MKYEHLVCYSPQKLVRCEMCVVSSEIDMEIENIVVFSNQRDEQYVMRGRKEGIQGMYGVM